MGFILAFLSTLFVSFKDAFCKQVLKGVDEYVVAWASRCFALPFLLFLLFFAEIPELKTPFWWALLIGGTFNMIAIVLFMKGVKYSDLSLSIPMLAFTPLFTLLASPFIVGELPGALGIIGVVLVVLGAYLLNIKKRSQGYLAPFKSLLQERGARLMLLVALFWSLSSNFDKMGVLNSSPVFWSIAVNAFNALFLFFLMSYKSKEKTKQISNNWLVLVVIGLFVALAFSLQMFALELIFVSYVIAIEKLNIILAVIFGWFFFKEKNIKQRFSGALIMVLGVLLMIFGN